MILNLLVATTNAGKLRDFAFAAEDKVNISPLPGLGSIAAPAEDEETFEGNARLKALYYSRFAPGKIVVADDSGLEVDALGGAPGCGLPVMQTIGGIYLTARCQRTNAITNAWSRC